MNVKNVLNKGEMKMKINLNIEIEISNEKYKELMENLKDVCGSNDKRSLENFISSGLEYDIEENNSKFLFD